MTSAPHAPAWITGVGASSPAGDAAATWRAVVAGERFVRQQPPPGVQGWGDLPLAPVPEPSAAEHLPDPKLHKYMSATTRLACAATGEALRGAGLEGDSEARSATGIFLGTGLIAFEVESVRRAVLASHGPDGGLDLERMGRQGLRRCNPLMPFRMLLNMPLGMASIIFGLRGANQILYPDAVQVGVAAEASLRALGAGRAPRIVVGGCSQGVSLLPLGTALRHGRVAQDVSAAQPYSPQHAGVAPGDGAGCLVVERPDAARRRGATPMALLTGACAACGAQWLPSEADAMESPALRIAEWGALAGGQPPDLLLTTGNADAAADRRDAQAWQALWPGTAPRLLSLDGLLGVAGPGSIALAACVAAQALAAGTWPAEVAAAATQRGPRRVLVSASAPGAGRATLSLEAAP